MDGSWCCWGRSSKGSSKKDDRDPSEDDENFRNKTALRDSLHGGRDEVRRTRKQEDSEVLDKRGFAYIVSQEFVQKSVSETYFRDEKVELSMNPHLMSRQYEPYVKFAEAYEKAKEAHPGLVDISKCYEWPALYFGNIPVRVLFHGTKQENVEPLLQKGLDPTKLKPRCKGQFWFSDDPYHCVVYCDSPQEYTLVVFAVLLPVKASTYHNDRRFCLPKEHKGYALPVATLRMRARTAK